MICSLRSAWARVMPEGRGRVNEGGLGFYERLVDTLLAHGIEPMATLYHWDLPAALDDRGGWLNPDIAHWFADYAGVVYRALDDLLQLVICEPGATPRSADALSGLATQAGFRVTGVQALPSGHTAVEAAAGA